MDKTTVAAGKALSPFPSLATEAKVQQRLYAGSDISWNIQFDRPVSQDELHSLGMHSWIEASWYVGNIYSCGVDGMRLPTIYETDASNTQAFLNYPDGSPVFAGENGLPSQVNAPTWTATSNASVATEYLTWNSDDGGGFDVEAADYNTKAAAVICVLPGS